jgi:hypothetical protein
MKLLIHFLGGENSLIVHLEFKVIRFNHIKSFKIIEANKVAMAVQWFESTADGQVSNHE